MHLFGSTSYWCSRRSILNMTAARHLITVLLQHDSCQTFNNCATLDSQILLAPPKALETGHYNSADRGLPGEIWWRAEPVPGPRGAQTCYNLPVRCHSMSLTHHVRVLQTGVRDPVPGVCFIQGRQDEKC